MAEAFEFERALPAEALASVRAAVRACAGYSMYSTAPVADGFAAGLLPRHDVFNAFLRTGGLSGRPTTLANLADRTNFFRATFAYGERVELPGIELLLASSTFRAAAGELYGCAVIEPAIVYANLVLPGQEIGPHTDVPEFAGMDRHGFPEWLLCVMHRSGLFADARLAIATAITWLGDAQGGAFCYWPDGPREPPRRLAIADNRGILLDTDSVVHGVEPVAWTRGRERPPVEVGAVLAWDEHAQAWSIRQHGRELARLADVDVRVSISWKAWCFADEAARVRARSAASPLTLDAVVARLRRDLADRGRLGRAEQPLEQRELALLMIDEYLEFPPVGRKLAAASSLS